jgi:DNA-binding beta-propeller fold protein YncE
MFLRTLAWLSLTLLIPLTSAIARPEENPVSPLKQVRLSRHLLYVATPGIRDYLEYGGQGILIFDIDAGHKFVKRLPSGGLDEKGKPLNVKGICANARTRRLYVTTTRTLMCFDLVTGKQLWEKSYEGGCDRLALSPDGAIIYLPSLEQGHWHVVDAMTGEVIKKIVTNSGAHNTIIGSDGRFAYLAGLKSPVMRVADLKTHNVVRETASPHRGAGLQTGTDQAPRLPQPRHRPHTRRKGTLAHRRL